MKNYALSLLPFFLWLISSPTAQSQCNAAFEWEQVPGTLEIHFNNNSTSEHDIISYSWTFGDTHTSDAENPTHVYEEPGTYVVCLIIEDNFGCVSDECHEVHVESASSDCEAGFTWDQVGNTFQVAFTNTSSSEHDIISWNWTFGDGGTSDDQNPSHTYDGPGTYVVCLIIEDNVGCVADVCHEVHVEGVSSDCDAEFTWDQVGGTHEVEFTNTSTSEHDIVSWNWTFGDGGTSDDQNPLHEYDEAGTYVVCLIIEDEFGCVADVCHEVHVDAIGSDCNAAFEWEQVNGTLQIHFNNNSTSEHDIISWSWTFGDGGTSDDENPTHTYDEPGTYVVCLILEDEFGCVSDVCHEVHVEEASSDCNAAFEWEQVNGTFEIHFINNSTSEFDIVSWDWTFGDGGTSEAENPVHIYDHAGTYVVCIRMEDVTGCVSELCHEVHVEGPEDCNAAFEWDQTGGFEVHFNNNSTSEFDIISWSWTFGDGGTSDDENPVHVYDHAGTYVVCLIMEDNDGCVSDVCHEVHVEGPEDCNAAFEWEQVGGTFEIHFFDNSTSEHDIISWDWTFGDGGTSDDENPVHVYEHAGTYVVCIRIEDETGCVSELCHEVHVEGPEDCNAAFEWDQVGGTFEIHFNNNSTSEHDIISWDWTFGDGSTSDAENPVHIYDHAGTYVVCLRMEDETGCVSEICHEVHVEGPEGCNAAFEWDQVGGTFEVHFDNNSTSQHDIISWLWIFGDGDSSNLPNPVHVFPHAGTYVVCLIIQDNAGCVSDVCHEVHVGEEEGCHAGFTWEQVEGTLEIHFNNTSTAAHDIISWQWTFGDGHGSDDQHPVHVYDEPGTYVVCLRIEDEFGCVSEICHEVHVENATCHAAFTQEVNDFGVVFFNNNSTGTTPNTTWLWEFGDGETSTEENPQHTYDEPGNYEVCLFIVDTTINCESHSCHVLIYMLSFEEGNEEYQNQDPPNNFNGQDPVTALRVIKYTNPVTEEIQVVYSLGSDEDVRFEIYDMTGYKVFSRDFSLEEKGLHNKTIDAGDLFPGLYFITISAGNIRESVRVTITR